MESQGIPCFTTNPSWPKKDIGKPYQEIQVVTSVPEAPSAGVLALTLSVGGQNAKDATLNYYSLHTKYVLVQYSMYIVHTCTCTIISILYIQLAHEAKFVKHQKMHICGGD